MKPHLMYQPDWEISGDVAAYCQETEAAFQADTQDLQEPALARVRQLKETAAKTLLAHYYQVDSLDNFIDEVNHHQRPAQFNQVVAGGRRLASPLEALHTTTQNLAIARQYAQGAPSGVMEGMLLSGSTAWGSFHSPHSGHTASGEKPSDVDLLLEVADTTAAGELIERYVENGLVDNLERQRFSHYDAMQARGEADLFSLRSHTSGTEVSIHVLPSSTMERLCQPSGLRSTIGAHSQNISVLKDFRPNTSSNAQKNKGYELNPLDVPPEQSLRFVPQAQPVVESNGSMLGYLAETPVGGFTEMDGRETYTVGVLPFFLVISPVIVAEKQRRLSTRIASLAANITAVMQDRPVINLPRQANMPSYALQHVQKSLSLAVTDAENRYS